MSFSCPFSFSDCVGERGQPGRLPGRARLIGRDEIDEGPREREAVLGAGARGDRQVDGAGSVLGMLHDNGGRPRGLLERLNALDLVHLTWE